MWPLFRSLYSWVLQGDGGRAGDGFLVCLVTVLEQEILGALQQGYRPHVFPNKRAVLTFVPGYCAAFRVSCLLLVGLRGP